MSWRNGSSGRVPIFLYCLVTAFTFLSVPLEVLAEEYENVCFLYTNEDYQGEPILSLAPSVKVFEANLVFQLGKDKGIDIQSVKLNGTKCSAILCDGKHLQGNCSEITESMKSTLYKNLISVDCHCSSSSVELDSTPVENKTEGVTAMRSIKLRLPSAPSENRGRVHVGSTACATIFRDWHYKGQSHSFIFPGSTGEIDVGLDQRIRSIYVKNGCTAMLWGSGGNKLDQDKESELATVSFAESASFLQMNTSDNFQWACCYCDQCSKNICSASLQRVKANVNTVPLAEPEEEEEPRTDFSQFVKYGKKIIGIGRNYRWIKAELASALSIPTEPIVFLKPTSSYIKEGQLIRLPESLGQIFYELELGVVIGKKGKDILESKALNYVAGYFLALDMTAKEFIKGKGNQTNLPWDIGKGFDTACPVGEYIPKAFIPDPNNVPLEAKVNGKVTQSDNTRHMIFNVQQLIAYVSKYMTLEPFDTILTGTPDGFGALKSGDVVQGRMGNITSIEFEAVAAP